MNYQRNERYFGQSIPAWPTVVSFILIAAGLFVFIFLGFSRFGGYLFIPIGLVMAVAGLVGMVLISNIKIKDSEIDELIPPFEEEFRTEFTSRFVKFDAAKAKYEKTYGTKVKNPGEKIEPVWFGTFCFDESRALHKVGSDGKSRSSIYSLSAFALKPDSICLGEREISLVSAEKPVSDFFGEIGYSELGGCEIVKTDKVGYSGITKYRHLRITSTDGSTVVEFPILADAAADEYAADINQRIRRNHEKNSEQES